MIAKLRKNIFTSRNPARNEKSLGNAGPQLGLHLETQWELTQTLLKCCAGVTVLGADQARCVYFLATGLPSTVTAGFISNKNP